MTDNPNNEFLNNLPELDIRDALDEFETELESILPILPDSFEITISYINSDKPALVDDGDIWYHAIGGSAITNEHIDLTVDQRIDLTKTNLLKQIRETYFHERFHIARGYSFESKGLTLLDVAIEEGLAVKFETIHAEANPWYGEYGSRKAMKTTLREVTEADNQQHTIDWDKWKFYDPETDRHWILYRLGTFIADEVLTNNPELQIQDLVTLDRDTILRKSKLLEST